MASPLGETQSTYPSHQRRLSTALSVSLEQGTTVCSFHRRKPFQFSTGGKSHCIRYNGGAAGLQGVR